MRYYRVVTSRLAGLLVGAVAGSLVYELLQTALSSPPNRDDIATPAALLVAIGFGYGFGEILVYQEAESDREETADAEARETAEALIAKDREWREAAKGGKESKR